MSTKTNDELPPNPLEKTINGIRFSIEEQTGPFTIITHYLSLDASPVMRRKIIEILQHIACYELALKKPSLRVDVTEWQDRVIRIEYGYTGSLVGADKIDWEELTDWLLTHALHQFKHQ